MSLGTPDVCVCVLKRQNAMVLVLAVHLCVAGGSLCWPTFLCVFALGPPSASEVDERQLGVNSRHFNPDPTVTDCTPADASWTPISIFWNLVWP